MAVSSYPDQSAVSGYPVRFAIQRPASQSRLLNFPLIGMYIRFFLLIPNVFIFSGIAMAAFIAYFMSLWAILFTGRYPRGLFKLEVSFMRWQTNISVYVLGLLDEYPPMDMDQRPERPLHLDADYPTAPSKLLNLPFLPLKLILVLPHLLILTALGLVASLLMTVGQFVILFTGSFPAGMYGFIAGVLRWGLRVSAYLFALTDQYPPFSMS